MQVQCQILSEDERHLIHQESLRILGEIGVQFHSPKARQILEKNGAQVDREIENRPYPGRAGPAGVDNCSEILHTGSQAAGKGFRIAFDQERLCAGQRRHLHPGFQNR